MNKKKILIVSRSFYPQISPRSLRTTELAKELARQGHDVTIITPKNNGEHELLEKRYGFNIKDMGTPRWKSPYFGESKIGDFLTRSFLRFLSLVFEYPDIELMFMVKKALRTEKGYDLLISIAVPYPIHWGVARSRKKDHPIAKIWVADCGDPYMGCETDTFKKLFYFKYVEKWFMRKTDFITIPWEESRSAYYPEFNNKIFVIPQGFDFTNIEIFKECPNNIVPTFAFAGSLSIYRDTAPGFFKFLSGQRIKFKFIIYTQELGNCKKDVELLGSKCEIRSYVPREELIKDLSKKDFLINFMVKTSVQKSSKLINYALTGRPILNIYPSGNYENIFHSFINGDYSSQYIVADLEKYNVKNVANQFLQLLNH